MKNSFQIKFKYFQSFNNCRNTLNVVTGLSLLVVQGRNNPLTSSQWHHSYSSHHLIILSLVGYFWFFDIISLSVLDMTLRRNLQEHKLTISCFAIIFANKSVFDVETPFYYINVCAFRAFFHSLSFDLNVFGKNQVKCIRRIPKLPTYLSIYLLI